MGQEARRGRCHCRCHHGRSKSHEGGCGPLAIRLMELHLPSADAGHCSDNKHTSHDKLLQRVQAFKMQIPGPAQLFPRVLPDDLAPAGTDTLQLPRAQDNACMPIIMELPML